MRILHVLSQRELTGAEVYALSLARYQARHGHTCLFVSGRLNAPCEFPLLKIPIDKRGYLDRVRNILALRRVVRRGRIDILHAHSRAASWIANVVSRLTGVPYVSTVHGRQSLHFTSRHFNVYGQRVIAVCPWLQTHLTTELGLPDHRVRMIPNAVD